MTAMRKMKTLALVFVLVALCAAAFTVSTPQTAEASRRPCCWVMVCTVNPPIICWEECIPCPTFP